jgi:hypothetical protein
LVHADGRLLATLGFGAVAWRVYDRDAFVGWSDEQRAARLQLAVNLARFLICPWVKVKFLASSILAQLKRMQADGWIDLPPPRHPGPLATLHETSLSPTPTAWAMAARCGLSAEAMIARMSSRS